MGLPVVIPTRTSLNANAASDVNGLMSNCTDLDSRVVVLETALSAVIEKLALVPADVLQIHEEVTAAQGGTFTSGAWRARNLNTVKTNQIDGASLASKQITLPAGTYWIEGTAPACQVSVHIVRLYDITNSAELLFGTLEYDSTASAYQQSASTCKGLITLTGETVLELQHRCYTTRADYGMGVNADIGQTVNIYATLTVRKL